ncbi:DUF3237 domain-containing protein [Leucobacter muris]|uniref:DUF3237 family protein n=1 Tax=Leucobacter muris TaxID=1935379 RepID=UPI001E61B5F3|nr:DUF3237 family protein [Leucobacter muris]
MIPAPELIEPAFEFCFELRVDVADAIPVGGSDEGEGLHFAGITGGAFEGPACAGASCPAVATGGTAAASPCGSTRAT